MNDSVRVKPGGASIHMLCATLPTKVGCVQGRTVSTQNHEIKITAISDAVIGIWRGVQIGGVTCPRTVDQPTPTR